MVVQHIFCYCLCKRLWAARIIGGLAQIYIKSINLMIVYNTVWHLVVVASLGQTTNGHDNWWFWCFLRCDYTATIKPVCLAFVVQRSWLTACFTLSDSGLHKRRLPVCNVNKVFVMVTNFLILEQTL